MLEEGVELQMVVVTAYHDRAFLLSTYTAMCTGFCWIVVERYLGFAFPVSDILLSSRVRGVVKECAVLSRV